MLRCQLPVHSPLTARSLWGAGAAASRSGAEALRAVSARLCRRYQADDALLCGSGTQALQVALATATRMVGPRAVLAAPAYSCYDVASAAVGARAPVVLYDVDPDTLAPDLDSLEAALRRGAGVVLAVSLYGVPLDWDALEGLAERHGAVLVEDAAQGHGASWQGAPLGSLGRLSVLSFGRGKGWTAGQGGAVLFRGDAATERTASVGASRAAAEVRTLAAALAAWLLGRPSTYGIPRSLPWLELGKTVYHPPLPPERITCVAAALLERTFEASQREAEARQVLAESYARTLEGVPGLRLVTPHPDGRAGYIRFPVRVSGSAAEFSARPGAVRLGIAPGYPESLARLAPLRPLLVGGTRRLPGADALAHSLVTLPTHSRTTRDERRRIVRLLSGPVEPRPRPPREALALRAQPS